MPETEALFLDTFSCRQLATKIYGSLGQQVLFYKNQIDMMVAILQRANIVIIRKL
ncbi:hypothetical protein Acife_1593 [Acidithiobacillus ferrivorans SS3]|uniref:Uncharacterized protein n=1 Tax=Acidithiobacillus ferrivorans SS3 TaxID=743299 RepID=G0JSD1_9PROT|nr:hypothetical protein [Acidithiobacillus ferrivorans]AEM47728.1 hypothetical protein Acife_1593 [Acidithiobacillus ferrivorans SS3]